MTMACPRRSTFASSMREYPAAQEFEPGASIHFASDDLESVDLTLDLSIAPRFGQRGAERVLVTAQARCERCQSTGFRLLQPAIQGAGHLLLRHRCKAADEIDGGGDGGRALQQGSDEPAVVVAEFVGFAGQKANRPARCRRLRAPAQNRFTEVLLWFGRWILPSALCCPIPHNSVLPGKAPVPEFPP